MYTPRHFAETDLAQLDHLIERDPFVTLITTEDDGSPFASHLPVLYRRSEERILIEGHWARPNPQARHDSPVLMIVHGPHHYLSPGWYPDKESAARVPTWNYAVAHLRGALRCSDDPAVLGDLVARLSARFEASVGNDWQFDRERAEHVAQLRGIVAFRFEPASIALKFKLSQNHPATNVVAAADALDALGDVDAVEIARMMRIRLGATTVS
jgi:transcriptional regulator